MGKEVGMRARRGAATVQGESRLREGLRGPVQDRRKAGS